MTAGKQLTKNNGLNVALDISALDPSFKAHAARGIGRYVSELYRHFEFYRDVDLNGLGLQYFQHDDMVPPGWTQFLPVGKTTVKQQLLYPLRIGRYARKNQIDVFHFPAHMDPPAWSPAPYIVTVLDLIPLVCEDMYRAHRPGWRFALARWLELRAIQNAALVIAISECTKNDVHRLLGVPEERIVVTPLGVDDKFFETSLPPDENEFRNSLDLPLDRKLILYVGGIDERKNIPGMLRSFARIVGRAKEQEKTAPALVLAGKIQGDRHYPEVRQLIATLNLQDDVFLPGYVPDTELRRLFSIVSVFWFMSFYEGFGLPPLEACAAGVPVVSSGRSVMSEVLGDAALLINPEDEVAAAEAVEAVLSNSQLERELREKGPARARLYPWSQTAGLTLEAYRRFAEERISQNVSLSNLREAYEGDGRSR